MFEKPSNRAADLLVIDDEPAGLQVLCIVLEEHGHAVRIASSGSLGLAMARARRPDLVLLDARMPGMNGYEVCRAMKLDEALRSVPVIFVSALSDPADRVEAFAAGGVDYVLKPFDIAEVCVRVEIHVTLQRAKQAADAANAFLAHMFHEIRTPMNAILGYTQLLQRAANLTVEQQQHLGVITRSGDHLLHMIDNVLQMSKIEGGHRQVAREDVDLQPLLGDVERMFRLRADAKGLAFEIVRDPELPRYIVSDEGMLRQVLVNLLGNAIKFTERGRVTVRISAAPAGEGQRLVAAVEDTGPGIAPEEMDGLFRPFVQASAGIRRQDGTGLGLALSLELARLLGGDIGVESVPGVGSVFRLDVPLVPGNPPPVFPAPTQHAVELLAHGDAVRILVADDHEDNRTWLLKLLQEIGFEVRGAANGAEALAAVGAWEPHLVLMDMHMPVMDGYAATRAIRERHGAFQPAIIGVTANAFDHVRTAILDTDANSWLRKPCREPELLEEIRRLLGVEYRYAESYVRGVNPSRQMPAIPTDAGALLSPALSTALRAAAHVGDFDRLHQLLTEIDPPDGRIAVALRRLVDEYAYDTIEAILEVPP
jgi:signal transduction histidine kinase